MTKGKKKKTKNLILLILAVIFMVIAYILLMQYKEKDKDTIDDTSVENKTIELLNIEEEKIESLTVKNSFGEMVFSKNSEDVIYSNEDELIPINQTYANNMFRGITNLTASDKLGEGEISEFGLDNPSIIVTAKLLDDATKTIKFGSKVPLDGGYYTLIEGDQNIYICNETTYNYYKYSMKEMTSVEIIPTISADSITHLKIVNENGENFEVEYDETKPNDYAKMVYWTIKQPYELSLPGDSTELTNLFNKYGSLSYLALEEYSAQNLEKYGLLNPSSSILIDYTELTTSKVEAELEANEDVSTNTDESRVVKDEEKINKNLTLLIGSKNEEGNYYVKTLDSSNVYTMKGETVVELIELEAFPYVYKFINLINISDVNRFDISFGEEEYNFSITTSTTKDGENETTTSTYYMDDKEVEEENFKSFYQKLISTKYDRELSTEHMNSTNVVLSVVYHLKNKEVITIEYLEYDESYYSVKANGTLMFLTDKRDVDGLKEKLLDIN